MNTLGKAVVVFVVVFVVVIVVVAVFVVVTVAGANVVVVFSTIIAFEDKKARELSNSSRILS